ncbi:AraC family transcriptional regulator [Shewanella sp. AS1]|uniref:AraC family transcriptional regulator n=1 Tax=Shewanella sp. AS1 TaxID=2907626 RepID=UPI001F15D417|nr:AraC family transcriptional regulator [Shewanella sp. AS1]MCE9680382.1 AraC family transcriptional regulator [Shewanella sp. AS1]
MPDTNPLIESLSDQLAANIARWTHGVEELDTAINGLSFYRRDNPTACSVCVVEPSIALVVQGLKSMALGDDVFEYDRYRLLITSLDLPAQMQVLEAKQQQPYLGLVLKLDLGVMSELMMQTSYHAPASSSKRGMLLGYTTPELLDACKRLVELLDDKDSMPVLAAQIKREIFWRVLNSEQGAQLRQIVAVGGQGLRINRAINWLKTNFATQHSIDALAELAQMSKSSFHHHFRELTSISPLQYQKRLRLLEARRLMLSENIDAANAAYRVGYESPSQFSREYSRFFGNPPKRDRELIRES